MRKVAILSILLVVLWSSGCPTKSRPSTNMSRPDLIASEVNRYLATAQQKYDCNFQGFAYTVTAAGVVCVTGPGANPALFHPLAKQVRDEMIEDALGVIDSLYGDFSSDLSSGRATANVIGDVIDLGTGAAIGITKGERPLQILGVALTAFRGGRKSVDLNYFKEFATPILITKMNDNRAKQYAIILVNKEKPIGSYGVRAAIRDIVAYFNAGTLVEAFNELAISASTELQDSRKTVLQLKGVDPASIVRIPADAREAGAMIARYRFHYAGIIASGSAAQRIDAQTKLRQTYLDVVADADFAAILTKVRTESPGFVPDMDSLADTDPAVHRGVSAADALAILREIFQALDLDKDAKLVVKLRKYYDKNL